MGADMSGREKPHPSDWQRVVYQRTIDRYAKFVPTVMGPETETIQYAAIAIGGEAGEVLDYVKKVTYHGIPLDKDKLDEEVGDVLWGIQAYCTGRGITMEYLMEKNMAKLQKRYPNGFVPGGGIR